MKRFRRWVFTTAVFVSAAISGVAISAKLAHRDFDYEYGGAKQGSLMGGGTIAIDDETLTVVSVPNLISATISKKGLVYATTSDRKWSYAGCSLDLIESIDRPVDANFQPMGNPYVVGREYYANISLWWIIAATAICPVLWIIVVICRLSRRRMDSSQCPGLRV